MNKKKLISIGIICFNEELNIEPTYRELVRVMDKNKKYDYEFIFSDNHSTDNTREIIRKISKQDKRVVGVFLSRNFGAEASILATMDHASGDAYIGYEGDMQDPAEVILDFIKEWEKGFDVVVGIRTKIEDSLFMTLVRKLYYRVFKAISNIYIPVDAGTFALLDKQAVDAIRQMPEKYRFYRGLRAWVGFKTSYIKYHRKKRVHGKSSYNFPSYINYTIRSFFGFSYLPLDIIVYMGFFMSFLSFIIVLIYLIYRILMGEIIDQHVITLSALVLFGGLQLLALSIIGKYIQVIVEETKARPVYIVEEIIAHH